MNARMMTRSALAIGLLAGLALTSPALSQPAHGQGRAQAGERAQQRDGEMNRERVRAMVEKRLTELEEREQALQELLALVNSDASDEVVREKVREVMEDARQGAGPMRGRGGRDGGQGFGPGGPPPEFLEHIDPRLHEHFQRMRREHPERAEALLERAGPRLERLEEMRENDPARFEARAAAMRSIHDAMRAAHEVIDASAEGKAQSEIDALKADFMAKVGAAVDAGMELRRSELAHAEERLTELRDEVAHLSDNREEIIQKRAEEMLARAARREVGAENDAAPRRGPRRERNPE